MSIILLIDCDPEGSLTSLFGMKSKQEIQKSDTLLPLYTALSNSKSLAHGRTAPIWLHLYPKDL